VPYRGVTDRIALARKGTAQNTRNANTKAKILFSRLVFTQVSRKRMLLTDKRRPLDKSSNRVAESIAGTVFSFIQILYHHRRFSKIAAVAAVNLPSSRCLLSFCV